MYKNKALKPIEIMHDKYTNGYSVLLNLPSKISEFVSNLLIF